jgi:hypothetical protein
MRRMAMALLTAAVVVQGGYLVKLERAVARLKVAAPVAEAAATVAVADQGAKGARGAQAWRPVAPPVFAATAAAAPDVVLETLGSSEGRQRLQEVLAALKEQRRQQKMIQSAEHRGLLDRRLEETGAAQLGLTPDEGKRFRLTLATASEARRRALDDLQSGARTRVEARRDLDAATRTADGALTELLGDKRLTAYRELRKREDQALRATAP